jgi:predicted acyl esterase
VFGKTWALSERRYGVRVLRDVVVPLADGTRLVGDLYRPDTEEPVPLILGFHPYSQDQQVIPMKPVGFGLQRGHMEAGDPSFYARRGYAHGIFNVRGTGKSDGFYQSMGPREAEDVVEAVAWLARQPWCDGNVGMFGVSYFSRLALHVAVRQPPALRAVFAPYGLSDLYRDLYYHGGIFSYGFVQGWREKLDGLRYQSLYRQRHGESAFRQALEEALEDDELIAVPCVRQALLAPEEPRNALLVDLVLERFDGPFYAERRVDYARGRVPAYFGACWGIYGLQLDAAFRNFEAWPGPKKLLIGPPHYLDRPLYQLQYESLRWFDHWLKGNDTGFMEEPPVRYVLPGEGRWHEAAEWPLPSTRWTPFYLHEDGLMSEHEFWPGETGSSFEDSPFHHGELTFTTPPLVEETDVVGPAVADLFASTTDEDLLLFVSLHAVAADGREEELTRGWLRASQRELDPDGSLRWRPRLRHVRRLPLTPGEHYRLTLPIVPLARRLHPGERLRLRLKAADDEPRPDPLRATAFGHVCRQGAARITIHHNGDEPSQILLPIVAGNLLETFLSGGRLESPGPLPLARIQRLKRLRGEGERAEG